MANGIIPGFAYNNRLQVATAQARVGSGALAYLLVQQPSRGTINNNGNLCWRDDMERRTGTAEFGAASYPKLRPRYGEPSDCCE